MSTATTISTHVLDTALGRPAANISVALDMVDDHGHATTITNEVTDADGRVAELVPTDSALAAGRYRLRFDVSAYFSADDRKSFYDVISIDFRVGDRPQHYHVPLLLSPFGYATYRGS
jgi:5-hydroxyisourate hydrolase